MSLPVFSIDHKVAIVTGALGLIGREHCNALASAGAHVIVTDLNHEAAEAFAASLQRASGRSALGVGADITDPASVQTLLERSIDVFGQVDVLVNNAAINDMVEDPVSALEASRFENYPLELWRKCLDVNVTGMFLCSQIVGTHMARRKSGSIINIASTYGIVAPDQSLYRRPDGKQMFYKSAVYPTAKGAVISFTRFLAAYWGDAGVRVNALSPGGVRNGQDEDFVANYAKRTPLGRMSEPNDYHGAIVFLASDASRYMTGTNLVVDGGWTAW
ncbi:MAG: SDR family oxidoreductase [Bacteroidetes bacterium]|nr:SDR family oxidoreductase [Bacteroidota bacterium]